MAELSFSDLRNIALNEQLATREYRELFRARKKEKLRVSQVLAEMSKTERIVLSFPRYSASFAVIFECIGEMEYCHVQTLISTYSEDQALTYVRSYFGHPEGEVTPISLPDTNRCLYRWTQVHSYWDDYLQCCNEYMKDDEFILHSNNQGNRLEL